MDVTVIDADGHVEPALVADWKQYVEAPYGDQVDRIIRDWGYGAAGGSSTRRGSWDPSARLEDMDREGIRTTVLFGSTLGLFPYQLAGFGSGSAVDSKMAAAVNRGYNNWMYDYCNTSPERLKAAAFVPFDTIDAACAEARRAVTELGTPGILVHPLLHESIGNHPLDDAYFLPIYEEAEGLDVPILYHAQHPFGSFIYDRYQTHFRRHAITFPLSIMMACMDAVCGGVMERFTKLRVAFFEGSAGWMPWFLDRLDEHFEKLPHFVPHIADKPSILFRHYIDQGRVFWSCEPDEKYLPFVVQEYGEDFIVYASDYPHWDCEYPESARIIGGRSDLTESAKRKILGANAKRLYGSRV